MARDERDREDLMREAVALVERIELRLDGEPEHVVVGFRRDGCASLFFGADPVYQFNSRFELRRAFCGGKLYKAESRILAELTRERTAEATHLVRRDLTASETSQFLLEMQDRLARLSGAFASGRFDLIAQVPEGGDLVPRIVETLKKIGGEAVIAASPRAV